MLAPNPNMIVLARESRGFTQTELAERIDMTQSNLGKIERGEIGAGEQTIHGIATVTKYPLSFFSQPGDAIPDNLGYRKREKVPQKILTPIAAKVNIVRMQVQTATRLLNLPSADLPNLKVTEAQTPAAIATQVRKRWGMKELVVDNVAAVLEKNGIAITGFDFGTERVDSRSVLTEDKYSVIVLNNRLLGDKQRFSLAYQLGQLVMHTGGILAADRDIAHEANLFAAEFLMPEQGIRKDFDAGISLPRLAELKPKWGVSMISLLYRADDLGYFTPNQKRYMLEQFNQLGIRRREPVELDIPMERPQLMRSWIARLKKERKLNVQEAAALFSLNVDEFIELYH